MRIPSQPAVATPFKKGNFGLVLRLWRGLIVIVGVVKLKLIFNKMVTELNKTCRLIVSKLFYYTCRITPFCQHKIDTKTRFRNKSTE